MTELIEVPPGLADVAVATTTVGDVLGDVGTYHYRGHDAPDLARRASFDTVASLVLDDSGAPVLGERTLPASVADLVPRLDGRSALSAVAAAWGLRPVMDIDAAARRVDACRLISVLPTVVAATVHGAATVPDPALDHVTDTLRMLRGDATPPSPELVDALRTYLVTVIDHGFNAGTFTARVVASTGADLGACVVAAWAALSGPRHGAIQTRVLDMLDEIGEPAGAEAWMRSTMAAGRRISGFGHAVYRSPDPRAAVLSEVLARIAPARHELVTAVERAGLSVLAGRRLVANVDLYAPAVLEACGIPRAAFTPTFAIGRVVGWCAHVLEQAGEKKIFRPAAWYVGPPPR